MLYVRPSPQAPPTMNTMPASAPARRGPLTFNAIIVTSAITLTVSVLIIVTGGIVRVTGSGLGCPTWPRCTTDSLSATPELGIHGIIEYGNRLLTGVLSFTVVALILAVLLQRHTPPRLIARAAWAQLGLVLVNAVVGGITVLTELNPWIVAAHLVAAFGLLTTTTITWHRVRDHQRIQQGERLASTAQHRGLAWSTLIATAVLVLLGTLVTGSGPHAGDSAEIARMPFDWVVITWVHGLAAVVTSVLATWLALALRASASGSVASTRAWLFVIALGAQAMIGIVQSLLSLPSGLVVLHLLGAALVWIGAVRLVLDTTATPGTLPLYNQGEGPATTNASWRTVGASPTR